MSDERVGFQIEAEGGDAAATATDRVTAALDRLSDKIGEATQGTDGLATKQRRAAGATEDLAAQQTAAATKAIAFTQRLQGAAMAVQALVGQLGGESRAAGLIGATLATSTQFAQLGSALGPQGALVGGIVGAAIPAINALIDEQHAAERAARAHEQAVNDLVTAWEAQRRVSAIQGAGLAADAGDRSASLSGVDTAGLDQAIEQQLASQALLRQSLEQTMQLTNEAGNAVEEYTRAQMEDERAGGARLAGGAAHRAELIRQIEATERTVAALRDERQARQDAATAATEQAAAMQGALADARSAELEDLRQLAEEQRKHEERSARALRRRAEDQERLQRGLQEEIAFVGNSEAREEAEFRATLNAIIVEQNGLLHEQNELKREANELLDKQRESAIAANEALTRLNEKNKEQAAEAIERGRAEAETQIGIVQNAANAIGRAIAKVAETNATAEESAKIALAATLEVIGQTAQMLAGMEFAKAIAAYPDVAGMALHAAAGLAFTAVAIGTGEGAGALNRDVAASQSARAEKEKPARPETSGGRSSGSGGNIVINWNSPIVTGQTQAEIGRNLSNSIREAQRRGLTS